MPVLMQLPLKTSCISLYQSYFQSSGCSQLMISVIHKPMSYLLFSNLQPCSLVIREVKTPRGANEAFRYMFLFVFC